MYMSTFLKVFLWQMCANGGCCKESPEIQAKVDEVREFADFDEDRCFTDHPYYHGTCLNPGTLQRTVSVTITFQILKWQSFCSQNRTRTFDNKKFKYVRCKQSICWISFVTDLFITCPSKILLTTNMYCTIMYDVACVHYIHVHVPGTIMLYNICILYCTMHSRGACDGYAIGLLHSFFFFISFQEISPHVLPTDSSLVLGILGEIQQSPTSFMCHECSQDNIPRSRRRICGIQTSSFKWLSLWTPELGKTFKVGCSLFVTFKESKISPSIVVLNGPSMTLL